MTRLHRIRSEFEEFRLKRQRIKSSPLNRRCDDDASKHVAKYANGMGCLMYDVFVLSFFLFAYCEVIFVQFVWQCTHWMWKSKNIGATWRYHSDTAKLSKIDYTIGASPFDRMNSLRLHKTYWDRLFARIVYEYGMRCACIGWKDGKLKEPVVVDF